MTGSDITERKSKKLSVLLSKRNIITPLISNRFKLGQAIEVLEMLKDPKIVERGVMNP